MKRLIIFTAFCLALFGGLTNARHAYAFDVNEIQYYIQPDNLYLDQNGDLIFQWHKVTQGFGGYNPTNGAVGIMISINGTTTDYGLSYNGPFSGWSVGPGVVTNRGAGTPGGCAPGIGGGYDSASSAGNGNTYGPVTQIFDTNAGHTVTTAGITPSTPIYLTLIGYSGYTCGITDSVSTPLTAGTEYEVLHIGSSQVPVQPIFGQPQDQQTIGQFPNWIMYLQNNTSTEATGTLTIHYGPNTPNVLPLTVTSTYDIQPGVVTQINVPNVTQMVTPLNTTTTSWYAQAEVSNASTSFDFSGSEVQFFVNPNAPGSPPYPNGGTIFTTTSSLPAAYCNFTSLGLLDDPIGNLKEAGCELFLPGPEQQADLGNQFNGEWGRISNRIPFGYVTLIFSAFTTFGEGNTTTTIISTSTYAQLSGVFDPMKTLLTTAFILLFLFWLFHFARNIKI